MAPLEGLSRDCAGSVLIEYAITLPLFLLLVFGIIDFGELFREYQIATNAAREGARMAVLPGYSTQDVQSRVDGFLTASSVTAAGPAEVTTTTIPPGDGVAAITTMTVTVHVTHRSLLPGTITILNYVFGPKTLDATSTMRTEVAAGGG